ncbi:MAG: DUF4197 domain-containing protein [Candidatus Deferrimicrobiaceae bacterium]
MRRAAFLTVFCFALIAFSSHAGFFDDIKKGIGSVGTKTVPDESQVAGGLKEALTVGTGNAVSLVSVTDGYFANQAIKILMPSKIQKVADVLGKVGYQKQVDEFVLSMNRAAEKAAPQAKSIFVGAIQEMTFEDAKTILNGGDTAATEFFKGKTSGKLSEAFKPIISSSMDEVGATRSYKEMMGKYTDLPFMKAESLNLDQYVTNKSLDGLFFMVGQEEKKIRTNPAARVTDLLKTVFGGK